MTHLGRPNCQWFSQFQEPLNLAQTVTSVYRAKMAPWLQMFCLYISLCVSLCTLYIYIQTYNGCSCKVQMYAHVYSIIYIYIWVCELHHKYEFTYVLTYICWLVVWNIFPYIGNNNPNWLSYFSEGLKPPTSMINIYIYIYIYTVYLYIYKSEGSQPLVSSPLEVRGQIRCSPGGFGGPEGFVGWVAWSN